MELSSAKARSIYERKTLIRVFEDRVAKIFAKGRIPGFVHLYAGEEAVAWACVRIWRTATTSPALTGCPCGVHLFSR